MTIINRWSDSIEAPNNELIYAGDSSNEVWINKEGQHIRVGDMTDIHVQNCYMFTKHVGSWLWRQIFRNELIKRGIYEEGSRVF